LNDIAGAQTQWSKALERLVLNPTASVDIDTFRPALQKKIEQAQRGEKVKVADTAKDEGGRMNDEIGRKDGGQ
jgi:hypothetical protein